MFYKLTKVPGNQCTHDKLNQFLIFKNKVTWSGIKLHNLIWYKMMSLKWLFWLMNNLQAIPCKFKEEFFRKRLYICQFFGEGGREGVILYAIIQNIFQQMHWANILRGERSCSDKLNKFFTIQALEIKQANRYTGCPKTFLITHISRWFHVWLFPFRTI